MTLRWLRLRIQKDYLFAPRHQQFRQILETARRQRYRAISLREAYSDQETEAGQRVLALRHDVDTANRQGVRLFLDLEREFGATATYYFRLQTLGMSDLVREILKYGSEVGYHFEEPATVAKQHRVTSRQELETEENRKRIDEMMEHNIRRVNTALGRPVQSLCSHNDFYNRQLGFENYTFLSDHLRQQFNILFEANDRSLLGQFDRCHHDATDEACLWHNHDCPLQAMREGVPRILVLTHPRQWHPAPIVNSRENFSRLLQGLRCRVLRL